MVLLILAGVSINLLLGQNGIISRAKESKTKTEIASIKEQMQLDIFNKQAENQGNISDDGLKEILEKYGTLSEEENLADKTLTTDKGKYEIKVEDIFSGTTVEDEEEAKETISKEDSYIGYYADIDGNGTVDGIIYADLAVGGSGEWGNEHSGISTYTIPQIENVKEYYISQKNYEGDFGTKDVLSPKGEGNERFYIMALEDFNNENGPLYYWYESALGNLDNYGEAQTLFGTGKNNTTAMITKWNAEGYGAKNNKDMWGNIQEEVANGWFVPSKAEWSAFAGELGITESNYGNYGLRNGYWSSSQGNNGVWYAYFDGACMNYGIVFSGRCVRLGATF